MSPRNGRKMEDATFIGISKKEHSEYNVNKLEGHRKSTADVATAGLLFSENNGVRR